MAKRPYLSEPPPDDDDFDDYGMGQDSEYDPEAEDAFREFTTGDSPELPCPFCKKTITEDHQRCPHCDSYIKKEDHSELDQKPVWHKWVIWLLIILSVAGALIFIGG